VPDLVEDHYVAKWGTATRRAQFEVEGLEIAVLKWDADVNPEGVTLYATAGATAHPLADGPATHRTEFFVGLSSASDEIASALAALGLYSTRHDVVLDHGHTVCADGPLWTGAAMRTLLVARARDGFLPVLELPDESMWSSFR
jgi:hypothetical protein